MSEIMKLADAYVGASRYDLDAPVYKKEARAALTAAVSAQEAEIEKLRKSENVQYMQEILHDLDALRADAARYRWLCEVPKWSDGIFYAIDTCNKEKIDQAIDAAIAKEATND